MRHAGKSRVDFAFIVRCQYAQGEAEHLRRRPRVMHGRDLTDKKIRLTEITVSTANATAKGLKNRIFSPGQAAAGHGSLEVIPLR
jgi:hypothetical protein